VVIGAKFLHPGIEMKPVALCFTGTGPPLCVGNRGAGRHHWRQGVPNHPRNTVCTVNCYTTQTRPLLMLYGLPAAAQLFKPM
jgi:hypothetical protein